MANMGCTPKVRVTPHLNAKGPVSSGIPGPMQNDVIVSVFLFFVFVCFCYSFSRRFHVHRLSVNLNPWAVITRPNMCPTQPPNSELLQYVKLPNFRLQA